MQIEPQTPLPAVYIIPNHTDPDIASYYVRAVVRDSLTQTTLNTVNLTYQSSGRYAGQFNAPGDGTGLGRQIDVTVSVYTDSGYTTKSNSYGDTIEKWYVKSQQFFGGGGGGSDVDYKRVRSIIEDVLEEKIKGINIPKTSLKGVLSLLEEVKQWQDNFIFPLPPSPKAVDLSPLSAEVRSSSGELSRRIAGIRIPETNLSPLEEKVTQLNQAISSLLRDVSQKSAQALVSSLKENIKPLVAEAIKESLKDNDSRNQAFRKQLEKMMSVIMLGGAIDSDSVESAQPKKKNPIISKYFPAAGTNQ